MTRTVATNFSGALQFPYATAATDLFKKEDVQTMALAVYQHDHSSGKGLLLPGAALQFPIAFPNGATMDGPTAQPNRVIITTSLGVGSAIIGAGANTASLGATAPNRLTVTTDLQVMGGITAGGQSLGGAAGAASLVLPGIQNPAATTIYWADAGAGPMFIQLRTFGGAGQGAANYMTFNIATGTLGTAIQTLQLNGSGDVIISHAVAIATGAAPTAGFAFEAVGGDARFGGRLGVNVASLNATAALTLP